jgi:hypothetical protein
VVDIKIERHPYLMWIPNPWEGSGKSPDVWFRDNAYRFLFGADHIVRSAVPYALNDGPNNGGVYFLINGDSIDYVGISGSISNRLVQHWSNGRRFSKYWCFGGLNDAFAEAVETFYIHYLEPFWNEKFPAPDSLVEPFLRQAEREGRAFVIRPPAACT